MSSTAHRLARTPTLGVAAAAAAAVSNGPPRHRAARRRTQEADVESTELQLDALQRFTNGLMVVATGQGGALVGDRWQPCAERAGHLMEVFGPRQKGSEK